MTLSLKQSLCLAYIHHALQVALLALKLPLLIKQIMGGEAHQSHAGKINNVIKLFKISVPPQITNNFFAKD